MKKEEEKQWDPTRLRSHVKIEFISSEGKRSIRNHIHYEFTKSSLYSVLNC